MALKVTHHFITAKADGPDSTFVKPTDWNDAHDISTDGGGGIVIGRDTSGPGALQELPLAYTLTGAVGRWVANVVGSFCMPRGTTAQRPAAATGGDVRWNTDLSILEVYTGSGWSPLFTGSPVPVGATFGWYSNTAPAGYLFLNGQSMGDASSGANFASDQYQALFAFLWTNLSDAVAPVLPTPRGGTANADWIAHKRITLPDECGRVAAGSDIMGGIPSKGRLKKADNALGPDGDILGSSGGEAMHKLIVDELAKHNHPTKATTGSAQSGGIGLVSIDGGLTGDTGGDKPHNTVQPTIIRNTIIKF